MKKLIITLVALSSFVFANQTEQAKISNEEILSLYKNVPHGIKLDIIDRQPLKEAPEYELVKLRISQGDMSEDEIIIVRDGFLIGELVNIKTGEAYKAKYQHEMEVAKLGKIYKDEKDQNIIKLGNDPKKPTLVVFTDADCPYCRQEMRVAEDRLKEVNLEIIMTSVHGDDSHAKSASIYKEIKNAKTDSDKIKILNKYYAQELKMKASDVSEDELKAAKELSEKYHKAGVNSVPYMVDKSELIK